MKTRIALLLALLVLGCGKPNQETPAASSQQDAVPVEVVRARKSTVKETVRTTGELRPIYRVDVYPKVAGIVQKEFVRLGSVVREGQVLAEVLQDLPGMEFSPVEVKATREGTITRDLTEVGAQVTPQQPMYTTSKIDPIDAVVDLPETYIGHIRVGHTVPVQLDAFPGKVFEGKIAEISPEINPATRTVAVKIRLPNPRRTLKPGMFCRADFTIGDHEGILVPLDAVVHSGVSTYIFVVRNGKAEQVPVETGTVVGEEIEVRGAVQDGDTVVVMGQNLLEHGTPVRILKEF